MIDPQTEYYKYLNLKNSNNKKFELPGNNLKKTLAVPSTTNHYLIELNRFPIHQILHIREHLPFQILTHK